MDIRLLVGTSKQFGHRIFINNSQKSQLFTKKVDFFVINKYITLYHVTVLEKYSVTKIGGSI